jgi:alcohol dehydrogenase (NADP+)
MSANDKFEGWVAHDKTAVEGKLVWEEYKVKEFKPTDIEMDIICCGICASDIHTLRSGWGPSDYPTVVGHEIVGKVTRVGDEVTKFKIGDRAGVGAQSDSCLKCNRCEAGIEPYCDRLAGTYQGKFVDGSGTAMGGYAKRWRGPGHFAVSIPDNLESHIAAPLMCGGITIASPLMDYGCGGPQGTKVGVIGIGGIGAFG